MSDEPIEAYLDELWVQLRRSSPRDARSLLAEAESHLRETAAAAEASGLSRHDAELEAVGRFGAAAKVARADRTRGRGDVVRGVLVSGWFLGALGAVAVGLSGVVAGVMQAAGASTSFLAGNRSTVGLSATDCARWLAGAPRAHTCAQAALADWAWETIWFRIAFGLLGLGALGALWVVRRRQLPTGGWSPLPAVVGDTVATTVFVVAGLWLAGLGVDALVTRSGAGAGQWLSAAPIALVAGVVFGLRLVRDLERPTPA